MNKTRTFSFVAGIFFSICFLMNMRYSLYPLTLWTIIDKLVLLGFAILMFFNKRTVTLIFFATIKLVISLQSHAVDFYIYNSAYLIASIFILAMTIVVAVPKLDRAKPALNIIWFIPGIMTFLGVLLFDCIFGEGAVYAVIYGFDNFWTLYRYYVSNLTQDLIGAFSWFFFGLWAKNITPASVKTKSVVFYQKNISGADRLLEIKELLDMGAITQEEFEEKKHQIIGK